MLEGAELVPDFAVTADPDMEVVLAVGEVEEALVVPNSCAEE